ncbi:MAG: acyl-CoA dehydrogenase family protein [Pseudomonadota bacterium]|nr:acyl-CoA dehydrogenase family protein [Pseudomonadota bacterium]
MELNYTKEELEFRDEVRQLLRDELTPEIIAGNKNTTTALGNNDAAMAWQAILNKRGWAGVAWPKEFGGTGWSSNQRYIFNSECEKAGAPKLIPLGLRMLAPVLFKYGTKEQQDYYLPKMLSAEHYWCQGYSEPGSGSDLASLKTRAERDGDFYVVNGTKIWTTNAHHADHIFCLVKTNPDVKPQAGISFLLIEMNTPGISVEPIITMAGDHEVNQVFFDNVRVPISNIVGPENDGWKVAKYLLEFERGGSSVATRLHVDMAELKMLLDRVEGEDALKGRAKEIGIKISALSQMETDMQSKIARGEKPGAGSSLMKIMASTLGQEISTIKMEAIGNYSLPHNNILLLNEEVTIGEPEHQTITAGYLNDRASTVFGGAREVQKNIIAKSVLGL